MDIPKWAEWEGVYRHAKLYLSKDRYLMIGADGSTDIGPNIFTKEDWSQCGWNLSEVNICLENK